MAEEIDYCQLMWTQLKKSKYYLSKEDKISVHMVLNLSDYLYNWEQSQLPKQFFKRKFESLAPLLKDYNFTYSIYEGKELYGCLDTVRETIEPSVDYYINISPDMYFTEHLLYYMIESSKQIKNKYFVLTPEIHKMWDHTWDEITNKNYQKVPYDKWNQSDIFDIRYQLKNFPEETKVETIANSKWAGWWDVYNKAYWEELVPIPSDWHGYGPLDYYSMINTQYAKHIGIDFQQWILRNQVVFEYNTGPLKENGFSKYYKDLLAKNDIPNQRQIFEKNMPGYLNNWKNYIKTIK